MIDTIGLITDFGLQDWYAAELKLTIKSLCNANLVDITHELNKFDIDEARFVMLQAERIMPERSIVIAVVDPGVGSKRDCLLLKKGNRFFIGPDNGIFDYIIDDKTECYTIKSDRFDSVSNTFHGRDIFAPLAAKIAKDERIDEYVLKRKCKLRSLFNPELRNGSIKGKIVYVDSFGNAITNIDMSFKESVEEGVILFRGKKIGLVKSYSGQEGLFAIYDSAGYLEISSYRGKQKTDFNIGEPVEIRRSL